jgi:GNAT superfamily N-acetyltransferase
MEARDYAADDVLRDGASVWIRAIRADDQARLAAFHGRLSPGTCALRAELGIVVEDTQQNRGIGTVLLKHLLGLAHGKGVAQIVAEVLPQNTRMLELVAGSGVPVRQTLDEGVIQLIL